eukprot:Rhum_TRINITY_DN15378_c7_g5::Rhum_TRINITY_DN15378_c7_g5_i1::g.154359::m.154359/K14293/KPNB1, IPO1; importin subunit beta-1
MSQDPNFLTQVLLSAQDANPTVREEAMRQIKLAEDASIENYLGSLMSEMSNEAKPEAARSLAGILLKNCMASKEAAKRAQLSERWMSVSAEVRTNVKNVTLSTLSSPNKLARSTAALVAANIARIELPHNQWPDFLVNLSNAAQTVQNPNLREASLTCVGYVCEEVDPTALLAQSGALVTAIVRGMAIEESPVIREEAVKALLASMEVITGVMSHAEQRKFLVDLVVRNVEPASNATPQTRLLAMMVLVKMVLLYYDCLEPHMVELYKLTFACIEGATDTADPVAAQALEFWVELADVETQIREDEELTGTTRDKSASKLYVYGATEQLCRVAQQCLLKQDEHASESDGSLSFSAGFCLQSVAICVGDHIVKYVMPFVNEHINSESWRHQEAAANAFGAIMEGTTDSGPLGQILTQAVQPLITHVRNPKTLLVKETTIWALGRMANFHSAAILSGFLDQYLKLMVDTLVDPEARIASKACFSIHSIAKNLGSLLEEAPPTGQISPYFADITKAVLTAADRPDASESGLRSQALEALNALIACAPHDCLQAVLEFVPIIVQRIQHSIQYLQGQLSAENKQECQSMQALYCGILNFLCRKIDNNNYLKPYSRSILEALHELLKGDSIDVQEEALLSVGSAASVMEIDFAPYLGHFFPFFVGGLSDCEHVTLCKAALGAVEEAMYAAPTAFVPNFDMLMGALLKSLKNPDMDYEVKPIIIHCIGIVAFNMEGAFETYIADVTVALTCAVTVVNQKVLENADDDDMVYYQALLRKEILGCFSGIVQGVKGACEGTFKSHVNSVVEIIRQIGADEKNTYTDMGVEAHIAAITLLGDLVQVYGRDMKLVIQQKQAVMQLNNVQHISDLTDKENMVQALEYLRKEMDKYP